MPSASRIDKARDRKALNFVDCDIGFSSTSPRAERPNASPAGRLARRVSSRAMKQAAMTEDDEESKEAKLERKRAMLKRLRCSWQTTLQTLRNPLATTHPIVVTVDLLTLLCLCITATLTAFEVGFVPLNTPGWFQLNRCVDVVFLRNHAEAQTRRRPFGTCLRAICPSAV